MLVIQPRIQAAFMEYMLAKRQDANLVVLLEIGKANGAKWIAEVDGLAQIRVVVGNREG